MGYQNVYNLVGVLRAMAVNAGCTIARSFICLKCCEEFHMLELLRGVHMPEDLTDLAKPEIWEKIAARTLTLIGSSVP